MLGKNLQLCAFSAPELGGEAGMNDCESSALTIILTGQTLSGFFQLYCRIQHLIVTGFVRSRKIGQLTRPAEPNYDEDVKYDL